MSEPAWMEGVRERDALFGLAPTRYEDTATWAGMVMTCPTGDSVYYVPGFLAHRIREYAESDGWRRVGDRMVCGDCAAGLRLS
jgi:hypothetical protein